MYAVVLLALVHRWVLGPLLRRIRSRAGADPVLAYPTVTVIAPMFDDGREMVRTIRSVMDLEYPMHRLEMLVVDDASTDGSVEVVGWTAAPYPNVHVLRNHEHVGWRGALDRGVRRSGADLVLALHAGDALDPAALRHLVRLAAPDVAAVDARVLAARARDGRLAPLEAVRSFLEEAWLRIHDGLSGSATRLPGRATLFRRDVLLDIGPATRRPAAAPAAREGAAHLLQQLLFRGRSAVAALDAVCFTTSRPTFRARLSRPARALRQGFAEVIAGLVSAWHLHPVAAADHLVVTALAIAFPLLVVQRVLAGSPVEAAAFAGATLLLAAGAFGLWSRRLPRERRVHPLWLLPAAVLMPVTSALLAPLAAFTLETGRGARRRRASVPQPGSTAPAGVPTAPERAA